jgi:hypothetical protein
MEAYRLGVKVFVEPPAASGALRSEEFIPVFHRWIQNRRLAETLIDVADYGHVHQGPGVVLIGHAANYALDFDEGLPGLLYVRKRPAEGAFAERLAETFRAALHAARLLEEEPGLAGKLRFGAARIRFRIHDRLLAPNGSATLAAVRPALEAIGARVHGGAAVTLHPLFEDPRALFTVDVVGPGALDVATAEARLGGGT